METSQPFVDRRTRNEKCNHSGGKRMTGSKKIDPGSLGPPGLFYRDGGRKKSPIPDVLVGWKWTSELFKTGSVEIVSNAATLS
jgi:hypothetical protein